MNHRQSAHLQTFRKVQWVLDHNAEALAGINLSHLRPKLDQSVSRLEMAVADQVGAAAEARARTAYKNELRRRLRKWHMQPIITFARANVAEVPAMSTYQMPPEHASDLQLVFDAMALARSAGENRERFVELGMDPGFIESMRTSMDEFDRALRERDGKESQRSAATEAMDPEIAHAWELVRLIGALIMSYSGERSEQIAAWRRATLHAPRPRLQAPTEMKLLPAGAPLTPSSEGAPAPGQIAGAVQQLALPGPHTRSSIVRRVFRLIGRAA
jgi:hypothetical protein